MAETSREKFERWQRELTVTDYKVRNRTNLLFCGFSGFLIPPMVNKLQGFPAYHRPYIIPFGVIIGLFLGNWLNEQHTKTRQKIEQNMEFFARKNLAKSTNGLTLSSQEN